MECRGCGKHAHYLKIRFVDGVAIENCKNCGAVETSNVGIPDVYWPGHAHTNPNITDRMGREILLTSRRHKAEVMRKQGISEAGDRVHGTVFGNYK